MRKAECGRRRGRNTECPISKGKRGWGDPGSPWGDAGTGGQPPPRFGERACAPVFAGGYARACGTHPSPAATEGRLVTALRGGDGWAVPTSLGHVGNCRHELGRRRATGTVTPRIGEKACDRDGHATNWGEGVRPGRSRHELGRRRATGTVTPRGIWGCAGTGEGQGGLKGLLGECLACGGVGPPA